MFSETLTPFQHGRIERDGERFMLYVSARRGDPTLRMTQLRLSYIGELTPTDDGELAMRFDAHQFGAVADAVNLPQPCEPQQVEPPTEEPQESNPMPDFAQEFADYEQTETNGAPAIRCEHGRVTPDGKLADGRVEWDGERFLAGIPAQRGVERLQLGYVARQLNYGDSGELLFSFGRDALAAVLRILAPIRRDDA